MERYLKDEKITRNEICDEMEPMMRQSISGEMANYR